MADAESITERRGRTTQSVRVSLEQCWKNISSLRMGDNLSDVKLKVGNSTYDCHRVVLSLASQYFEKMFSSGFRESQTPVIQINDVPPETMPLILDYIYEQKTTISEANVADLMTACNFFLLDTLKEECVKFMKSHITPSNCLSMHRVGTLYNDNTLKMAANNVMCNKFEEMSRSDEFLEMSTEELKQFVLTKDINVPVEDPVFCAVCRWVRHDEEHRRIENILPVIRLAYCTPGLLISLMNEPLLSSMVCQTQLQRALAFQSVPSSRHLFQSVIYCGRRSFSNWEDNLILLGGVTSGEGPYDMCKILSNRDWHDFCAFTATRSYAACMFGEEILVLGGTTLPRRIEFQPYEAKSLDFNMKVWSVKTDKMTRRRREHGMVVLNDWLYVVGGTNEFHYVLDNVERYNISNDKWEAMPNLPKPLSSPLVVATLSNIYVFGGRELDKETSNMKFYKFSPITQAWEIMGRMPHPCPGACAVVVNDHICIVGGKEGHTMMLNTKTHTWEVCPGPSVMHTQGAAAAYRLKILLSGGKMTNGVPTDRIDEFDIGTKKWSESPYRLPEAMHSHALIPVHWRRASSGYKLFK